MDCLRGLTWKGVVATARREPGLADKKSTKLKTSVRHLPSNLNRFFCGQPGEWGIFDAM